MPSGNGFFIRLKPEDCRPLHFAGAVERARDPSDASATDSVLWVNPSLRSCRRQFGIGQSVDGWRGSQKRTGDCVCAVVESERTHSPRVTNCHSRIQLRKFTGEVWYPG